MPSLQITTVSIDDECKKTGIKIEDIKKLREWVNTQPHLPHNLITDLDILLAFNACNQSYGVTKQVMDLHYTLRTMFRSFFHNRTVNDPRLLKTLDVVSHDGSIVTYHCLLDYDTKVFVLADILRSAVMLLDLYQYEYGACSGLSIVINFQGVTLSHLGKLEIVVVQQFLYYLQEAMFLKIKEVHLLNAPSFIDKLMLLLKPFMKKELLESIRIHQKGSSKIELCVPIASLPKDAGGQYKSYKEIKEETLAKLRDNEEFFFNENKKRVTESLRPGKGLDMSEIFGSVQGSFKNKMSSDVVSEFPLEDEYKKTTGITPQDIAELRKWLHTQPHLPGKYITGKRLMTLLDTRSRDGSAIWFSHFMDPDPKIFNFGQAIRAVFMLLDLWQYELGTWPGFIIVIDFEHMSLGHLAKLDLQNIQQFLYYLQLYKNNSKMSFKNKVVIITGASSGIGAATAILFSKEKANAILVGRNETKLAKVAALCITKHLVVKADVSKEDEVKNIVKRTLDEFGKIDVLVNNAGIMTIGTIREGNILSAYDNVMATNVRGAIHLTCLCADHLIATKGNIINVSSIAGVVLQPGEKMLAYSMSKVALNFFSQGAALELSKHGVRVNIVSPGPVATDIILNTAGVDTNITWKDFEGITLLNRVSEPEEIAELIAYLASDKARGITGSNFEAILVKLKGLHFINAPSFIDKILLMMRPFMKKELMDILCVHQVGSKTLDKYVPMEALPSDAGGSCKTTKEYHEAAIAKMNANKEYFIFENKKRAVEALRPGKPKTISDIFGGVEGSFKKLDID
ncbi:putative oxidoreductase [Papilio machaon]|uniref:Putative oxidoreductase n=1 Tax=Papilio machaon TaxID=76193 RepID=A0A0N0PCB2_PAPMA|nr:putative oxidoreductase [Papilio machaon]